MDETGQAIEVLKILIQLEGEAITIGFKILGKNGLDIAKKLAAIYHGAAKLVTKKRGSEESMKYLLKTYGTNLKVLQVPEEKFDAYKEALKKWKVPFAAAPDLNLSDRKREFFFPAESADRVNEIIKKMNSMEKQKDLHVEEIQNKPDGARIISQEEYVDNAEEKRMDELIKDAKKDTAEIADATPEEKQDAFFRLKEMHTYTEYQEDVMREGNKMLVIPAEQVGQIDEENRRIEILLPESDERMQIPFENAYVANDDKGLIAFINEGEDYELIKEPAMAEIGKEQAAAETPAKTLSGKQLFTEYFCSSDLSHGNTVS